MSLTEVKEKMTYTELEGWLEHNRDKWGEVTFTHWFLAQIALEIVRLRAYFVNRDQKKVIIDTNKLDLKDYILSSKTGKDKQHKAKATKTSKKSVEEMSPEELQAERDYAAQVSKSIWLGWCGIVPPDD